MNKPLVHMTPGGHSKLSPFVLHILTLDQWLVHSSVEPSLTWFCFLQAQNKIKLFYKGKRENGVLCHLLQREVSEGPGVDEAPQVPGVGHCPLWNILGYWVYGRALLKGDRGGWGRGQH